MAPGIFQSTVSKAIKVLIKPDHWMNPKTMNPLNPESPGFQID
jgi:hypothetical protein